VSACVSTVWVVCGPSRSDLTTTSTLTLTRIYQHHCDAKLIPGQEIPQIYTPTVSGNTFTMGPSYVLAKVFILYMFCAGIAECLPRVTRSVSGVEITFFPGLTEDNKDAVVFEQWRRFLEEEEAELAREESVALKLLQQERASLVEPIEYATQKRLLHQFKGSKKHRQEVEDNTYGLINVIGTVEAERRTLESINNIEEPLELVLLGPTQIENTAYSMGRSRPQKRVEVIPSSTIDPLSSLQSSAISSEAVSRLLGDAPPTYNNSPVTISRLQGDAPSTHHSSSPFTVTVPSALINSSNPTRYSPSSSNHEEEKNKRIQEIIHSQQQISEVDLHFLLEDERVSAVGSAIVPHGSNENSPVSVSTNQESSSSGHGQKWTKEEQIDWEETHEYDA
ncbi:unnamed protein product, partial [Meganyctiphanes norvegica]